jgi:hypothetical protein
LVDHLRVLATCRVEIQPFAVLQHSRAASRSGAAASSEALAPVVCSSIPSDLDVLGRAAGRGDQQIARVDEGTVVGPVDCPRAGRVFALAHLILRSSLARHDRYEVDGVHVMPLGGCLLTLKVSVAVPHVDRHRRALAVRSPRSPRGRLPKIGERLAVGVLVE